MRDRMMSDVSALALADRLMLPASASKQLINSLSFPLSRMQFTELVRKEKKSHREKLFQRLISYAERTYCGLIGLELTSVSRSLYGVILPNPHKNHTEKPFKVSIFDRYGPVSHWCFTSQQQCLRKLIDDGITIPEKGAVDRISSHSEWYDCGTHLNT